MANLGRAHYRRVADQMEALGAGRLVYASGKYGTPYRDPERAKVHGELVRENFLRASRRQPKPKPRHRSRLNSRRRRRANLPPREDD